MDDDIGGACDLLVISPHTDDAEIGLGGTMAALAAAGRKVWALDLTGGELGSNASPDERWAEAAAASAVLCLTGRLQLELPDGFIASDAPDQIEAVGAVVRRLRPRWVVTAPDARRHPDHVATPGLVKRAVFLARLARWRPELGAHRLWDGGVPLPEATETWQVGARFEVCAVGQKPTLVMDISETWSKKREALACYASQFARGDGRRATMINAPEFLEEIERRALTWGRAAGVGHGEALVGDAVPVLTDLPDREWC